MTQSMSSSVAPTVNIVEPVDAASLARVRQALRLKPHGRLTDDWDYEFGYRYLRENEGASSPRMALWRADDRPWYIAVSHPGAEPSAEEVEQWRQEIIDGIKTAGLTPDPVS